MSLVMFWHTFRIKASERQEQNRRSVNSINKLKTYNYEY